MEYPPARSELKGPKFLPQTCGLCQLLDRYGAIYSVKAHELEFVTGTLQPIRCERCAEWFLVQEEDLMI